MKPVFVLSLPRSGSTLLQRIIGAHAEVATTSEPWILLPLCYMREEEGLYAEYNQRGYIRATHDFQQQLPQGESDFEDALRSFVLELYRKAATEQQPYFLDKTPRYHLIAEEIMRLFPQGKFVFLWRNPVSVVASLLTMDEEERWNLPHYKIDLYKGLDRLVHAFSQSDVPVHSIHYEDLITDTEQTVQGVFSYLDLDYEANIIATFDEVQLEGQLGDPTGTKEYSAISSAPLHKWKNVLNTPIRKRWIKRYLQWIGSDRLQKMGYDAKELLEKVEQMPVSLNHTVTDLAGLLRGQLRPWLESYLLKEKVRKVLKKEKIYNHT